MTEISIIKADLSQEDHQRAVLELVNAYAEDPMGNGRPLTAEVRERLIPGLQAQPTTVILIAYLDDKPTGIAVCFGGFSTFVARPLLNLHDLAVLPDYRGQGIGKALMAAVEAEARAGDCCRVTLEVLANNPARKLYESCGFAQAEYEPEAGGALFYTKNM